MKETAFNCPACNQKIEAPAEIAGQQVTCPTCNGSFIAPKPARNQFESLQRVTRWVSIALLLIVGFWVIHNRFISPNGETPEQEKRRFEKEAKIEMQKECSNTVIGISRIISTDLDSDKPHAWSGEVTAEFVNRSGGIERTNLPFKFELIGGHVISKFDWETVLKAEAERNHQAFERSLQEIRNSK